MTLSRTNVRDLPKFIRLARELGAQVELSSLARDSNYETIRIEKSSDFLFDYKSEVLAAYPDLMDRYLKKADRLGKRLGIPIYKAGDLTCEGESSPRPRLLTRLRELFRSAAKSDQGPASSGNSLQPCREKDPTFENLPLCLLPWTQMVIGSKGDLSLCCVQGTLDHLKHYSSIEEAWHSERVCRIREQLSRRIFPPECETADCTVKRWNSRVCIIHQ
jgi:MoaA/NifB/PqqE/SkfB family radical SAM enzyme